MAKSNNALRQKYENGTLKRGDKSDYWGRTEEVVGKDGWKNPPWTKYPKFRQAMESDPYSPVLCTIARNYLYSVIWVSVHRAKGVGGWRGS